MKTSNVLASVLFSTLALAAPLDRRAYATKTNVEMEYYTVYTTVTGAQPAAATTSDLALFYEEPKTTVQQQTSAVTTSSSPSSSSPSSSLAAPTVVASKPSTTSASSVEVPSSTSVYTPPPASTTTQAPPPPEPTTTQAASPPPSSTYVAPASESTSPSTGGGQVFDKGSYTMNYYGGGLGACGDPIADDSMTVALAIDTFGEATVDSMTGKTTNQWCGKKIEITNGGNTAIAYIKDRCAACTNGGLDATPALWKATTGGLGGASGDRIYTMSWKVID